MRNVINAEDAVKGGYYKLFIYIILNYSFYLINI